VQAGGDNDEGLGLEYDGRTVQLLGALLHDVRSRKRQNRWTLMDLDAKVCYCFHVTRRKLVNFTRINRPHVPSQLSECGGAGTGCGWCIPFLKQIHQQTMSGTECELEKLTPEEYERMRAAYIRAGKGKPPPGATPLPEG
jgi:bacterioferritin-associated ferredoxin